MTSRNRHRPISVADVKLASMLGAGMAPAGLLPPAGRGALARLAAGLPLIRAKPRGAIPPGLLDLLGGDDRLAMRRLQAAFFEDCLMVLNAWAPWRRLPDVTLTGCEFLESALANGRGGIIWVQDAVFAPLVAKMALAAGGYRVGHLSRASHRFSDTAFGLRYLNPVQTRIEDRFLDARLIIDERNPAGGMVRIRRRLAAGGLVSITAGGAAAEVIEVPFMGCSLDLPAGPPRLSLDTGAPLIPLFVTRVGVTSFLCHLATPLDIDSGLPRDEAFRVAAFRYALLLERYLRVSPELWGGWMR